MRDNLKALLFAVIVTAIIIKFDADVWWLSEGGTE
jgi:hypothetical protein